MKIRCSIFLIAMIFTLCSRAQVTMPLTESEIKANSQNKEKLQSIPDGNFYPRKYRKIPGDDLREKITRGKDLKWALSEAITNTVVRKLTRGLRQNDEKRKNKVVVWKADRKRFSFEYRAFVKNSVIVREVCILKFPDTSVLKTRNGKMLGTPNISRRELAAIIKSLKKSDLKVKHTRVGVRSINDKYKADQLLDYLGIKDNSTVYVSCRDREVVPEVKIIFN